MKKIYFTIAIALAFILFTSCSDDCDIDSQKITSLSAEITVLEQKISETTLSAAKEIYRKQITELEKQITIEANKCE